MNERRTRYIVLDSERRRYARVRGSSLCICSTSEEIARIDAETAVTITWIACSLKMIDKLLRTIAHRRTPRLRPPEEGSVLAIAAPRAESIPALHGLFAQIIGDSPAFRWLPREQVVGILLDAGLDRSEVFLAAASDPVTETLLLVRADLEQFIVPFSIFPPSGDGKKPNFADVRVTDYGHTISLGKYEAAADAILYECDRDYRRKLDHERKQKERTFGSALFRLRLQKGLTRRDFTPLTGKTIARIERNEIAKPHGKTLETIASRLGVSPGEIAEY